METTTENIQLKGNIMENVKPSLLSDNMMVEEFLLPDYPDWQYCESTPLLKFLDACGIEEPLDEFYSYYDNSVRQQFRRRGTDAELIAEQRQEWIERFAEAAPGDIVSYGTAGWCVDIRVEGEEEEDDDEEEEDDDDDFDADEDEATA